LQLKSLKQAAFAELLHIVTQSSFSVAYDRPWKSHYYVLIFKKNSTILFMNLLPFGQLFGSPFENNKN
jgi:hypothetical protein